jgi:hypothetical protein
MALEATELAGVILVSYCLDTVLRHPFSLCFRRVLIIDLSSFAGSAGRDFSLLHIDVLKRVIELWRHCVIYRGIRYLRHGIRVSCPIYILIAD